MDVVERKDDMKNMFKDDETMLADTNAIHLQYNQENINSEENYQELEIVSDISQGTSLELADTNAIHLQYNQEIINSEENYQELEIVSDISQETSLEIQHPFKFMKKNKFACKGKKIIKISLEEDWSEDENDFQFLVETPLLLNENLLVTYQRMKLQCQFICIGRITYECNSGISVRHLLSQLLSVWFTNLTITFAVPVVQYTPMKLPTLDNKNTIKYENITLKDEDIIKIWYYREPDMTVIVIFLKPLSKKKIIKKLNLLEGYYSPFSEDLQDQIVLLAKDNTKNHEFFPHLLKNFPGGKNTVPINDKTAYDILSKIMTNHKIPATNKLSSFPVNFDIKPANFKEKEYNLKEAVEPKFSEAKTSWNDNLKHFVLNDPRFPNENFSGTLSYSDLKKDILKLLDLVSEIHSYALQWPQFLLTNTINSETILRYGIFETNVTQMTESILNCTNIGAHLQFQQKKLRKVLDDRMKLQDSLHKKNPGFKVVFPSNINLLNQSDHDFFIKKINLVITSWNSLLKNLAKCRKLASGSFYYNMFLEISKSTNKDVLEKLEKLIQIYNEVNLPFNHSDQLNHLKSSATFLKEFDSKPIFMKWLQVICALDEFISRVPPDNLFIKHIEQEIRNFKYRCRKCQYLVRKIKERYLEFKFVTHMKMDSQQHHQQMEGSIIVKDENGTLTRNQIDVKNSPDEEVCVESQTNLNIKQNIVKNQVNVEKILEKELTQENKINMETRKNSLQNQVPTKIHINEKKSIKNELCTEITSYEDKFFENQTDMEISLVKKIRSVTLLCKIIKFGRLGVIPTSPNNSVPVSFSEQLISFPITPGEACSRFIIKKDEIYFMRIHVTSQPYIIFMRALVNLNDSSIEDCSFEYDALGCYHMIFILKDSPSESQRNFLQDFYPMIIEMHDNATLRLVSYASQVKVAVLKDLRIQVKRDIFNFANFSQEITVRIKVPRLKEITISGKDLACLNKFNWLNGSIIDIHLNYILSKLPCEVVEKIHLFTSLFYTKCRNTNFEVDSERKGLSKWSRSTDIFSKEFIIIPACEKSHWILIIVYMSSSISDNNNSSAGNWSHNRPCILLFNSMPGGQDVVAVIRKYLQCEFYEKKGKKSLLQYDQITTYTEENLPLKVVSCPAQTNRFDCGLFILQFMKSFFEIPSFAEFLQFPELQFERYITTKEVKQDITKMFLQSFCK